MTKIAHNIKIQRKKLQISQEEMAGKLYVTRQTISNYENGRSNPDLETLQQIADILETDMDYLLYGEQKPKDKKAIRKNALILGLCLLIMAAVSITGNYERQLQARTFGFPAMSWFMYVLGYPVLLVISSASMTRLIMLFTESKPLLMKYKRAVHKSILYSFITYSIIMLPNALTPAIMNIRRYIWEAANPEATSYSFSLSFGAFLNRIYYFQRLFFDRYPVLFALFVIIGSILALAAPGLTKRKKLKSTPSGKSEQQ